MLVVLLPIFVADIIIFSYNFVAPLRMLEELFFGCTLPPDSKEMKLGSTNQEAFPSVPHHTWKFDCKRISGGVDIPGVHGCYLLRQIVLSEAHKNDLKDWSLINSQAAFPVCTSGFDSMNCSYYQRHVN